jgi:hypothetical protein
MQFVLLRLRQFFDAGVRSRLFVAQHLALRVIDAQVARVEGRRARPPDPTRRVREALHPSRS